MALDDPPADGQADSTSFVLIAADKALEGFEDAVRVLRGKPNPLIFNADLYLIEELACKDPHLRRFAWLAVFKRIPDQILHELAELQWVAGDNRQAVDFHFSTRTLDLLLEVGEDFDGNP